MHVGTRSAVCNPGSVTPPDRPTGYFTGVSDEHRAVFGTWADLCRLGRDAYFRANVGGFDANPGTEAAFCKAATLAATWPGGPWPAGGPAESLHQVGLMLGNSAAGRLGELGPLLDAGEVFWSLPGHARGVMEVWARLFRIYTMPFLPQVAGDVPSPGVIKSMFAAAHREIISATFSAKKLADATLAQDPTDTDRQADAAHVDSELARVVGAYVPHYDPGTTNTSSSRKLALEGVGEMTTTALVDAVAAWIWPDPTNRPPPLYKVFSGHAHSSLDADVQLYRIDDASGRRVLTRELPKNFIENNLLTALAVFLRSFARLVEFYGWNKDPLNEFTNRIAELFPGSFEKVT